MIKFKLRDLTNIINAIKKIIQADLPVIHSYKISKILKKLDEEFQSFEMGRSKLLEKYGEKDGKGNFITDKDGMCKIKNDKQKEFAKDYKELLDIEVELDCEKISLNLLMQNDIKLSSVDMLVLEDFIIDN